MLSASVEKAERPGVGSHLPGICWVGYEDPHKYLSPAHQLHCVPFSNPRTPSCGLAERRTVMDAVWHGHSQC